MQFGKKCAFRMTPAADSLQDGTENSRVPECHVAVGLTFKRHDDLGSVHLEFGLKTCVDTDYAHKAEDRRSVSGGTICFGGTRVSWLSRIQKCVILSTRSTKHCMLGGY